MIVETDASYTTTRDSTDAGADPVWTGHQILVYCPRTGTGATATHDGLEYTLASS